MAVLNFMRALQLRKAESDRGFCWGRKWKQRVIRRGIGKGTCIPREDYKRSQEAGYAWNRGEVRA